MFKLIVPIVGLSIGVFVTIKICSNHKKVNQINKINKIASPELQKKSIKKLQDVSKSKNHYDVFKKEYLRSGLKNFDNRSCGFTENQIFNFINQYIRFDEYTLKIHRKSAYSIHPTIRGKKSNNIWWWTFVFGHTIPTREAISRIIRAIPINNFTGLSIGSGKGLWEYLLELRGCNIICTDIELPEIQFKNIEIIDKSDVYHQLIKKCIISNVKEIDVLILIWPAPDINEDGFFDEKNGYDDRALKGFKGKYVVFICEDPDDELVGTAKAKKILKNKFEIIDIIPLPHYSDYNPVVKIFKRY